MAIALQILKLLERITPADLEGLAPAERRRLADLFRHWAKQASDPPPPGVLSDLKDRNGDG